MSRLRERLSDPPKNARQLVPTGPIAGLALLSISRQGQIVPTSSISLSPRPCHPYSSENISVWLDYLSCPANVHSNAIHCRTAPCISNDTMTAKDFKHVQMVLSERVGLHEADCKTSGHWRSPQTMSWGNRGGLQLQELRLINRLACAAAAMGGTAGSKQHSRSRQLRLKLGVKAARVTCAQSQLSRVCRSFAELIGVMCLDERQL